jgi:hypothetical protein
MKQEKGNGKLNKEARDNQTKMIYIRGGVAHPSLYHE